MTDFEYIIGCLLIPVAYVLVYIAGKYDFIGLLCQMLEEKAKEMEKAMKDDANV